MTINLISIELFLGLVLGLLIGLFVKSFFSKHENINSDDYAKNLKDLQAKIESYEKTNSEDGEQFKLF